MILGYRWSRRRRIVNRMMEVIATVAALVAVAVLVIVVASVAKRARGRVSWDFFTKPQNLFGRPGGGISNAIIGTVLIVGMACAIALPVGVLTAIYLTEFAPRWVGRPIQLVIDVLAGLPTIVIGIFVYGAARRSATRRAALRGACRAGDRDAPARRPRHAGDAPARALVAAGRKPCARCAAAGARCSASSSRPRSAAS